MFMIQRKATIRAFTGLLLCMAWLITDAQAQQPIKLNQVGFHPESEKIAIIPVNGQLSVQDFHIIHTQSGETVFTGQLTSPRTWSPSGESVVIADFSAFNETGTYRIEHADAGSSYPFEIREKAWERLTKGALKAYYFNRASMELKTAYAGPFARQMGHPDDAAMIHASAATEMRPTGYVFDSSKGWYDAGDYNKYVVNSGISTYTLLVAYEHFPNYFSDLDVHIPESGGRVPDILAEVRWNLDWMLTMQDPHDGGVYHKLTSPSFIGTVLPHQDQTDRYAVQKSTAAALNFAAVMAVASRIYQYYDPDFAARALEAAEYAWQWAEENPRRYYDQAAMNEQFNPNIVTGEYGDRSLADEFDWAAAELYISTLNDDYWHARNFQGTSGFGPPSWQDVRALAWISLANHRNNLTSAANPTMIENLVIQQANSLRNGYQNSAYRVSMGMQNWHFLWGSNGLALNQSMILLQGYRMTGDESYLNAAQSNLDYVLGRNATGYSFVTGFGSFTPQEIHHRISAAMPAGPIPGLIVGGPNPNDTYDCGASFYPSEMPAKAYLDDWCSYSTNEVAINWNAPLVYVAGALESIMSESENQVRAGLSSRLTRLVPGMETTLSWAVTGDAEATLNGQAVSGRGTMTVSPQDTTEYVLIAAGADGQRDTSRVWIHVLAPEEYNHALNSKVTASSVRSAIYPAQHVVDWNETTFWKSQSGSEEWIYIALDQLYDVSGITVEWGDRYAEEFTVETSIDAFSWETVFSETAGSGGRTVVLEDDMQARYVRLNIHSSMADYVAVSGIEVRGAVSEEQPSQISLQRPQMEAGFEQGESFILQADVRDGTLSPESVRFLMNGNEIAVLDEAPYRVQLSVDSTGTYEVRAVVSDSMFEIVSESRIIHITPAIETDWYDVADAVIFGEGTLMSDPYAYEGTFVDARPDDIISWDQVTNGIRGMYDYRIGYRLQSSEPVTVTLFRSPNQEFEFTLDGEPGLWKHKEIHRRITPAGTLHFEIRVHDKPVDIAYFALRGEGATVTSSEQDRELAAEAQLHQNYPNPFNPTTSISYYLPESQHVTIKVYNLIGQEVALLTDRFHNAGTHTVSFDASNLASGLYMYRMQAGEMVQTRKMMLVK
ncbi:glycoside hydrolase family 9 protein [Balneolaceae bacterium ANBcel3]|nr:glycoside hydrolase family 9 protein [Balneolaceae bacterium ANBcel3]